jgi:hypothetical protein
MTRSRAHAKQAATQSSKAHGGRSTTRSMAYKVVWSGALERQQKAPGLSSPLIERRGWTPPVVVADSFGLMLGRQEEMGADRRRRRQKGN